MRSRILPLVLLTAASLVLGDALLLGDTSSTSADGVTGAAPAGPPTPPMGWNSWNSGVPLTERNVHAVIDAMSASGMVAAGYRYVNLDAGWAAPDRDAEGNLRADPQWFPHGIAALADYAHSHGMLLGLYSSPFNQICGQARTNASFGHETADARTFAAWGVDFLKYDWCRTDADLTEQVRVFSTMRDALRASGRRIVYSINPNSSENLHAAADYDWSRVADMTRNTGDLIPLWHNGSPTGQLETTSNRGLIGVTDELGAAEPLAARSRPGYWNDPDMLVVGVQLAHFIATHVDGYPEAVVQGPLTTTQTLELEASFELPSAVVGRLRDPDFSLNPDEQRSHFTLWSMLAAPLIAGNDVRSMTETTRAILTNPDVIAIDQDPTGTQAAPLPADRRILTKRLADGSLALAIFNPAESATTIETTTAALGLPTGTRYTVQDLWTHTTAETTGVLTATGIPAHGVTMLKLTAAH